MKTKNKYASAVRLESNSIRNLTNEEQMEFILNDFGNYLIRKNIKATDSNKVAKAVEDYLNPKTK